MNKKDKAKIVKTMEVYSDISYLEDPDRKFGGNSNEWGEWKAGFCSMIEVLFVCGPFLEFVEKMGEPDDLFSFSVYSNEHYIWFSRDIVYLWDNVSHAGKYTAVKAKDLLEHCEKAPAYWDWDKPETKSFSDIKQAFDYIDFHPLFESYEGADDGVSNTVSIEVVQVNPETKEISNNPEENIAVRFWLECGPIENGWPTHDIDLDVGGATFEKAIMKLAEKIKEKYG